MKKVISIALVILMIASTFCACSSAPNNKLTEKNITKTVDVVFEALKTFDTKTVKTYVDSTTLDIILTYASKKDQFKSSV